MGALRGAKVNQLGGERKPEGKLYKNFLMKDAILMKGVSLKELFC